MEITSDGLRTLLESLARAREKEHTQQEPERDSSKRRRFDLTRAKRARGRSVSWGRNVAGLV